MKNFLMLAALTFTSLCHAQSTGLRTGTRIGLGSSYYSSANFNTEPSPKLYIQGGGLLVYGFSEWFALRADLQINYSSTSGQGIRPASGVFSQDQPYTEKYMNIGLGLPLAFHLSVPREKIRPYLDAGIMIQSNLFNTEERQYDDASTNNNYGYQARKMEGAVPLTYFGCFGLGLELDTEGKDYFFEFRMFPSLSSLGKSSGNAVNVSGFTFGGGVLF